MSEAHTKGTAILQMVKVLRANKEAALAALPQHLQHYLDEQISRTRWYPEEDYIELLVTVGKIIPPSAGDVWDLCGRLAAEHDLTTVYRGMILKKKTLFETLGAVKDLFEMYHDTGRVVIAADEQRGSFELFDYATVSLDNCRFILGYAREYMRISFGRAIQVVEVQCRALGHDRCRWEFKL